MKEFMYKVVFKNGETKVITVSAESVLDGHYCIYRQFGKEYSKSTYLG